MQKIQVSRTVILPPMVSVLCLSTTAHSFVVKSNHHDRQIRNCSETKISIILELQLGRSDLGKVL